MGKDPRAMRDAARFRIPGAIIELRNAGQRERRGAHRAGLERHIEAVAGGQAFAAQPRTGRAQREDLGMRRGIVELAGAIARPRHHLTLRIGDHRAHRHLAAGGGGARLLERDRHVAAKTHAPDCPGEGAFASAAFALGA